MATLSWDEMKNLVHLGPVRSGLITDIFTAFLSL